MRWRTACLLAGSRPTAQGSRDAAKLIPTGEALDVSGLDMTPAEVEAAVHVDAVEWAEELEGIGQWYDRFGESLPAELRGQLDELKQRFSNA